MAERGEVALRAAERVDLEAGLHDARASARRHATWALFGVSPGAVIPLFVSMNEFGMAALGAVTVGVVVVEGYRAFRASRKARRVEALLEKMDDSQA